MGHQYQSFFTNLQIRSIHEKALNLARIPYISLVLNATSKDYNCKIPR